MSIKKYLKNDDAVAVFETWNDLRKYLQFRKEHDEWIMPFINELSAVGIPNEPLFIPQHCTNIVVQKNSFKLQLPDIDYENEENEECIKDTGLFLTFPYRNKIAIYPTRRIAYATICKRADDDCGTMYRFDVRPNKSAYN